jgi:hypothetical protein
MPGGKAAALTQLRAILAHRDRLSLKPEFLRVCKNAARADQIIHQG